MSDSNFTIKKHTFPGQHIRHYAGANRHRDEDVQYLEVKQYTPLDNKSAQEGDITVIGTCAVSFPKEMYEPLWDDLLAKFNSIGLRVRSIWCMDKSDHGASGILNEEIQGDDPSYFDLSRDILNMINIFREHMVLPLVGIGHSMGGTALIELSRIHPRLLTSLVVVDPIVGPKIHASGVPLVYGNSRRPDLWPSREEAEKSFRAAKALKSWDPRVMNLWLKHGFRDTPTLLYPEPGRVTLRTTKATEAWNYVRPWFEPLPDNGIHATERRLIKYPDGTDDIVQTHPFFKPEARFAWEALPGIRHSVLYVFPDPSPMGTAEAMAEKVAHTGIGLGGSSGERAGRVNKVVIDGTGHLVAFEKPEKTAGEIAEWLSKDLKAWEERRKFEQENRDDKSINKAALSDEWVRRAKQWFEDSMPKLKPKL